MAERPHRNANRRSLLSSGTYMWIKLNLNLNSRKFKIICNLIFRKRFAITFVQYLNIETGSHPRPVGKSLVD